MSVTFTPEAQATLWGNAQATLRGSAQATLWGNAQARNFETGEILYAGEFWTPRKVGEDGK